MENKELTPAERAEMCRKALRQMAEACAGAELSESDVRRRLSRRPLNACEVEKIIGWLRANRFIDDRRYAGSFAYTRMTVDGWGRWKVYKALRAKNIDERTINEGIASVRQEDCEEPMLKAMRQKARGLDMADRRDVARLYRYLVGRGYDSATVGRLMALARKEWSDG